MGPLEILSEAVIDTLKEFSTGKRLLTPTTLKEAFSAREEIVSLLSHALNPPANGICREPSSGRTPRRVPLSKSDDPGEPDIEMLSELRSLLSTILDNLGPAIKSDYENRFSELQQKVTESESSVLLIRLGERIGQMAGELINEAIERAQFSNNFLVELSKDLSKMEDQLSSYENFNRETHLMNSDFDSGLLSHTIDMHNAIGSGKSLHEISSLITSRLNTISKAIEEKRQSDEIRLREADTKITELQTNLRTYRQEILEVKERSETLEKEVLLDELTQIHNRRAYQLQIREDLVRYHRNGERFSLIMIDIDNFKRVNDEYGHDAGDKCLKEIASLIKYSLRQSDFLARYGGEEMIAIVYGSDAKNARSVAEKIRDCIEKARFHYRDEIIPLTVSLGVTEVTPTDTDPETPFIRADEAMYWAKQGGRNKVFIKK